MKFQQINGSKFHEKIFLFYKLLFYDTGKIIDRSLMRCQKSFKTFEDSQNEDKHEKLPEN